MSQNLSTNTFTSSKYIVSADATQGTHTTITAALSSASSGDTIFIRPGTYTEDLTLKAGVNLTAYNDGKIQPYSASSNVTIVGKMTMTATGGCSISGVKLKTNGDYFLVNSGSNAATVLLYNCYLNPFDNTGINFTNSSASSNIVIDSCFGQINTTGITYWTVSGSGILYVKYSNLENVGASTTQSTNSSGTLTCYYNRFTFPIASSSSGIMQFDHCKISTSTQNVTALTHNGDANNSFANHTHFASGTASAVSIGGTFRLNTCTVDSTNTNAVTGAGTVIYTNVAMTNTSSVINTTTKTGRNVNLGGLTFDGGTNVLSSYVTGTFTPALGNTGAAPTVGYAANGQVGRYTKIGPAVLIFYRVALSSYTAGTGTCEITGLPYTSANVTNQTSITAVSFQTVTFGASVTGYSGNIGANVSTVTLQGIVSAAGYTTLVAAGAAATSIFGGGGWYSTS